MNFTPSNVAYQLKYVKKSYHNATWTFRFNFRMQIGLGRIHSSQHKQTYINKGRTLAAPSSSTQNTLEPALSIDDGAAPFLVGELLLLRIPVCSDIPIHQGLSTSTRAGSGVPPTSNAKSPQHFAFIRSATLHRDGFELEVYAAVSFSNRGGAMNGYNDLNDRSKATLIPLPPLSRSVQTPEIFGEPLSIRGWVNSRDAWLLVVPITFIMPTSRPVSVVFL